MLDFSNSLMHNLLTSNMGEEDVVFLIFNSFFKRLYYNYEEKDLNDLRLFIYSMEIKATICKEGI